MVSPHRCTVLWPQPRRISVTMHWTFYNSSRCVGLSVGDIRAVQPETTFSSDWEVQSETPFSSCDCSGDHSELNFIFNGIAAELLLPGGCFSNVSRALQDNLSTFVYCRNCTSCENFKLELCTCAPNHSLDTLTKFQLENLNINVISGIVHFREIILES